MTAFEPHTLAADLAEVRHIFDNFFANVPDRAWEHQTEKDNQGWTLRQTVAHLDSVAYHHQQMIEAALARQPYQLPGMTQRTDLPTWLQS